MDKSAPDYQERERAAAKLAREMEREGRSKATTNVHLLEERGVDVSHIDEEVRSTLCVAFDRHCVDGCVSTVRRGTALWCVKPTLHRLQRRRRRNHASRAAKAL